MIAAHAKAGTNADTAPPAGVAKRAAVATRRASAVVEEAALELAGATLARGDGIVGPPGARRTLVRRVRELLGQDPTVTWSAGELAAAVGVSPHHLMRVFRRETGMTLRGYRIQLRLALAMHRLRQGHCDLAALAAELGFASHAHLTDTFARCLGASPRELRAPITC